MAQGHRAGHGRQEEIAVARQRLQPLGIAAQCRFLCTSARRELLANHGEGLQVRRFGGGHGVVVMSDSQLRSRRGALPQANATVSSECNHLLVRESRRC